MHSSARNTRVGQSALQSASFREFDPVRVKERWENIHNGSSFLTDVRQGFLNRDLTRADVREIVRRGFEHSSGSFSGFMELFHMPLEQADLLVSFLYQYELMPEAWTISGRMITS
ncbi:MAG: hypothetical protein KW788_00805 [Candidatus Doudnabacteria bacterium]|nr:hypothetical protein [Candidatus Doudnabacteria bacterium]